MRILSWNVRRAAGSSKVWDYIREADPCISMLQEVTQIPADIQLAHHIAFEPAVRKTGKPQSFGNAIISKMPLHEGDHLYSDVAWVNDLRSFFAGNLLMRNVTIANGRVLNLLNIYSPAWSVPTHLTEGLDLAGVKLVLNPQLYCTEIIWKRNRAIYTRYFSRRQNDQHLLFQDDCGVCSLVSEIGGYATGVLYQPKSVGE